MAELKDLKAFVDAYGVGVRAGAITPQVADESYIRELFDLPPMSPEVVAYWQETDGVRKPLTIKTEDEEALLEQQLEEAGDE